MRAFLWPVSLKANPGCLGRLGRVLHWAISAGAAVTLFAAVYTLAIAQTEYGPRDALGMAAASIGIFVFGRALRYVLAAE